MFPTQDSQTDLLSEKFLKSSLSTFPSDNSSKSRPESGAPVSIQVSGTSSQIPSKSFQFHPPAPKIAQVAGTKRPLQSIENTMSSGQQVVRSSNEQVFKKPMTVVPSASMIPYNESTVVSASLFAFVVSIPHSNQSFSMNFLALRRTILFST